MLAVEKHCPRCQTTKPASEFNSAGRTRLGLHTYCKVCVNEKSREWALANPERVRESNKLGKRRARQRDPQKARDQVTKSQLPKLYGISIERYRAMEKVHTACAICGEARLADAPRLCVDHCAETGRVRGLLCNRCNLALGAFRHSPFHLERAIAYLKTSRDWRIKEYV